MSAKQEEKYKKRYDRLVEQIATLYGKPIVRNTATIELAVVGLQEAPACCYVVRIATGFGQYETLLSVRKNVDYFEDVVAVIGREVRRLLRDRIRSARRALRR